MPLDQDLGGGGTNADGTKNTKYCSLCYQNGEFTTPNMTLAEMHELVIRVLREHGHGFIMSRVYASVLPRLERWKKPV